MTNEQRIGIGSIVLIIVILVFTAWMMHKTGSPYCGGC